MANLSNVKSMLNGAGIEAEIMEVAKNGTKVTGIRVGSGTIRPLLYTDDRESVEELFDRCVSELKRADEASLNLELLLEWGSVKDIVTLHVRPVTDDGAVTRKFLDLELCCELNVNVGGNEGVTKVNGEMLEKYGITEDELFETASKNSSFNVESLARKMERLMLGIDENDGTNEEDIASEPMLFCSNKNSFHGAAAITKTEIFRKIAEAVGHDIFILPSSIHEVLVITEDSADVDALREMVREVNRLEVAPVDRLSDNVYKYSLESDKVTIA